MSRVQLALNVPDLEEAVQFYSRMFGSEPAKRKPGYANFAIADPPLKLVLFEAAGAPERLNHLGVEVPTAAGVREFETRLVDDGMTPVEGSGTCCFATQEKVWLDAPDGAWEVYAVLEDSDTFGASTRAAVPTTGGSVCCASSADDAASQCC